jgi:subtilisin family serine protease
MTSAEGYMNEYDFMDGTSMAAPMVAGVVALMKSRHPNLTPAEIKARLEGTARDLGAPGFDERFGHGLVDAPRAIL